MISTDSEHKDIKHKKLIKQIKFKSAMIIKKRLWSYLVERKRRQSCSSFQCRITERTLD